MQQYNDDSILNSIYKNTELGQQAIFDLIPKVEQSDFLNDIKTQQAEYASISSEAVSKLSAMGIKPEPVGAAKKLGMKAGVNMNTMFENSTSHLAQMMIKGSSNGIVSMTRALNNYPNPNPEIKGLADRLIQLENQNIERLKNYL
jgi:hypothetical protein